jgi:hypothetical protein
MVSDGIANDFGEKRFWISDLFQPVSGLESPDRDVLFEIFVVKRCAGFSRNEADESSNLGRIDFHFKCDRSS